MVIVTLQRAAQSFVTGGTFTEMQPHPI